MTAYDRLLVDVRDDGTAVVTLNRPDSLNAIDAEMFADIRRLAEAMEEDDRVRVVVITGAGRGFCSGADLAAIAALPDTSTPAFMRFQESGAGAIVALRQLRKPVIAAVNGPAAGGGLAIALAADVRIAAPSARFNVAFVRLGLSGCDVGVSWLLPRTVGAGHASEMMLTGRLVEADEALRIGLVNAVVPAGELLGAALAKAAEIARNSPFGLRLTKEALQLALDAPSLQAAVALENRNQVLASRTEEMAEAVQAFLERREPRFGGR